MKSALATLKLRDMSKAKLWRFQEISACCLHAVGVTRMREGESGIGQKKMHIDVLKKQYNMTRSLIKTLYENVAMRFIASGLTEVDKGRVNREDLPRGFQTSRSNVR